MKVPGCYDYIVNDNLSKTRQHNIEIAVFRRSLSMDSKCNF